MKKTLHLGLAIAVTLSLSSCYGSFGLTKKLYNMNGQQNKWAKEGVFLCLSIPAIFTGLGDLAIFNAIEFWSGKNPMMSKATKSLRDGDRQTVMNFDPQAHSLRVDSFEKGRAVNTVTVLPSPDGHMVAKNAKGEIVLSAAALGDIVVLTDGSGKIVARRDASELARYSAN